MLSNGASITTTKEKGLVMEPSLCMKYHLFCKSCNECNPSSISIKGHPIEAIRDCPIAFMSWNKLVDIFAN